MPFNPRRLILCSIFAVGTSLFLFFGPISRLWAQESREATHIIINGDQVEYSTDNKQITATGNVEIIYKGAKLTCRKITVNTLTKDGVAEGDVRLEDAQGVVEGSKIFYNFEEKKGTVIEPNFRLNPYFGRADKMDKVSDKEYVAQKGYASTCDYDIPHYRIQSKKINIFPEDKIQTRQDVFYVGKIPFMGLPRFNQSLKDPLMHVRLMPGKTKDWGPYMLSAWRYNLNKYMDGRLYFDYRDRLGLAGGFGLNYNTNNFGRGDLKFYYSDEEPYGLPLAGPQEFTRYFGRLRHKWEIDARTSLTSEFYKIHDDRRKQLESDRSILKDYFYREYEKDTQPLSYALLHHNFIYSSIDFLLQKRTNHWFDQLNKLPEINYSLASINLGNSPFYFSDTSSFVQMNKKSSTTAGLPDETNLTRLDSTNKLSLPLKVAFLQLGPFLQSRQTIYDKTEDDGSLPIRTIFYSGVDVSTKFYRIFDVKSNFLKMDINGLRHIITPAIAYKYNHEPTITNSHLRQFDSVDSITRSNTMELGLSNKLQTKRKGVSVDFLDFQITNTYVFKPKTGDRPGSNLSDFLYEIKLLPYSWLRIDGDATYCHSGARSSENYRHFSVANYDFNLDFGGQRSFGLGQRYQRKGGNEIVYNFNWRLNPKWNFSLYHRREMGHDASLPKGVREQEYSIERDLHCWTMSLTYNVKRSAGESIWLVFRLKAFPELEFGLDQSYHQPKPGSQSNP